MDKETLIIHDNNTDYCIKLSSIDAFYIKTNYKTDPMDPYDFIKKEILNIIVKGIVIKIIEEDNIIETSKYLKEYFKVKEYFNFINK